MALQVWLPLNKSGADKNQGLGDSTITNFGAVYESSGKLGGCYKCTKSAGIHIESKPWMKMVPGNSFSVSMWIKGCSGNTWAIACTSWELNFRTSILSVYPGGTLSNGGCAIYQTFDNDTWYHIAFSYNGDTSKLSLYLNGEFKQEYVTTYTREGIASTITLPYGDTRYINDFRIYDHCLSPKEVKEISKGLVLHYPLNDAACSKNLASNTDWERTSGNEYMQILSTYQDAGIGEYTFSCEMKVAAGTPSINIYYADGSYTRKYKYSVSDIYTNGVSNGKLSQQWQKVVCKLTFSTETADSTVMPHISTYYTYGSGAIISVRNPKLEKGWNPNPIYTNSSYNTVYDCSGYQNNGTITGALSCNEDSPRYKISTHFTSSIPSRITLPSDMSCLSGNNEQTLSCWVKSSGLGSGMSESGLISLGYGNTLFLTASRYCYRIDNSSNLYQLEAGQNPHDGEWHLVTATYKSGIASIYIDGVLKNSVSRTFSNRYINMGGNCIGTEVNNGPVYNLNGDISDVRMYVTALSAEDIKELYNTSCIINS